MNTDSLLRAFETPLIYVRQFAEQNEGDANPALTGLVRACEDGIDDILKELDEYQSHLGPASKVHKSRVKDSIYKIKFLLFKEEDIEEWERKMITHATSIVMLQTACVAKSHTNLCRANDYSYIDSTMDQQKSLQATALESSAAVTTLFNAAVEEQIQRLSNQNMLLSTETIAYLQQNANNISESCRLKPVLTLP